MLVWWYWILLTFACLKSFYFSINLNEILARYSNLACRFFPFRTSNISCHSLLACRVSIERSAVKHMGFHCMFLVAFPLLLLIFFLCVQSLLVWFECVLVSFSLGLTCMGFFVPLQVNWLFPFPCWGNFQL